MKMKLLSFLFLLICTFSLGKDVQVVDSTLIKPSYTKVIRNPDMLSYQLKNLRDQGDLTAFYDQAKQLLKLLEGNFHNKEELNAEKKQDLLWCCYLVANTPLIELNSYSKCEWLGQTRDLDYSIKERISDVLGSFHSSHFFPDDKNIEELRAAYYACIIRDLKRQIDLSTLNASSEELMKEIDSERTRKREATVSPELVLLPVPEGKHPMSNEENQKRLKEWQDEGYAAYNEINDEYTMKRNMILRRAFRNRTAARLVSQNEKDFVATLVNFFPENKRAVEKYILQAGFGSDEMDNLIDRTVGRDKKTEFLYKGERGRRHDKKVREASAERKH